MGEFSILTIKLLFLFLPGIVYRILYERWQLRPKKHFNIFIIYSFIGSVVFYGLYYLFFVRILHLQTQIFFMNNLLNPNDLSLHYTEIFWTVIIALISVYAICWIKTNHIIDKIKRKVPLVEKIINFVEPSTVESNIGVWDWVFDNCEDNACWVKVYNPQQDVIYYGWITKYSEDVEHNELYLTDVQVIDSNEKIVKEIPGLYIAQRQNDIIIEFISKNMGEKQNDRQKQTAKKSKSKNSTNKRK